MMRLNNTRKEDTVLQQTPHTEDHARKERRQKNKTTFEQAAPVGWRDWAAREAQTCSTHVPAWCLATLPAISFLLSTTAVSLLPLLSPPLPSIPWSGFLPLLLLPHSLGRHPRRISGAVYSAACCLIFLPPHNQPFGCFKDPLIAPPQPLGLQWMDHSANKLSSEAFGSNILVDPLGVHGGILKTQTRLLQPRPLTA